MTRKTTLHKDKLLQVRADSWASGLTYEQELSIYEYSKSHNYQQTMQFIEEQALGVRIPTIRNYYKWRKRFSNEELIQKQAGEIAGAIEQVLEYQQGFEIDYGKLARAYTMLAEYALSEDRKAEALFYHTLAKGNHRMYIEQERLKLAQDDARIRQEATKTISSAELTPEEREARLRQIFAISH